MPKARAKSKAPKTITRATIQSAQATDRHHDALEMRKAGHTFRAIADKLGYATPDSAYKAVQAAMQKSLRSAGSEELRALELERLDRMQLAIWPMAIGTDEEGKRVDANGKPIIPHGDSIDRVLSIMARRAKLLGLDAPTENRHAGHDGGPILDLSTLSDGDLSILARIAGAIVPPALAGLPPGD